MRIHAASFTALLMLAPAVWSAPGDDSCPAPAKALKTPAKPAANAAPDDHRIHIESDSATVGTDGKARLEGAVTVRQDERSISADTVDYDNTSGRILVKGRLTFEDPQVRVHGATGSFDTLGNAMVSDAQFELLDRNGRGSARELSVNGKGRFDFQGVRYTTCPVGDEDWVLKASTIDIDTAAQAGVGRGVRLDFKGIPILYTPYISFPVGDARKSGFLFPTIGNSSKSGVLLGVPYYFNLAPNYDLTLAPGLQSKRGAELGGEFRYLSHTTHGTLEGNFLPHDSLAGEDRHYEHVRSISDFRDDLRLDVNAANVSDSSYFEDFALGSEATSVTYLERRADLLYKNAGWLVRAQLQNFQTIDLAVADLERPYSRVPRVQANGLWPLLGRDLSLSFDGEAVNFLRDDGVNGLRLDVSPELRYSKRGAGYYFEPAAGWRFTQYDLRDQAPGAARSPTRELPYFRLDTGLTFERASGSHDQRVQTLEPELVYTYVPYRNQDALPVFDTGLPDLNLVELFRTNRFVGADRMGDANQLSIGMTTRLFDQATGAQYLSATLGQTRYFKTPRVTLPGDPVPTGNSSDIVGQLVLTAYKNWNLKFEYQWDPADSLTQKSEMAVQYRPQPDRVINLGYRFRRGLLEQWDGSFGWPIARNWSAVGHMIYSTRDHQAIEQVAGFEYRSCCWRVRVVQRRYVSSRTGDRDTSIALQLELTGLSSVGVPADSFLERTIRGYSSRTVEP
ncbi:MAG: LPS-assembly protein LptD [Proteobacteria bacterium]|nr:LPS-assembly protein LptD [Pseudomonadota bacterium]